LVGQAYRSASTVVSHDFLRDERTQPWHQQAREAGVRSGAAVPLVRDGGAIGVLMLYSDDKRKFDEGVVGLLERLAENIVFALNNFRPEQERKRNEKRVQFMATHDDLTQLPNRTMFNELLRLTLSTSERYRNKFAVLFI